MLQIKPARVFSEYLTPQFHLIGTNAPSGSFRTIGLSVPATKNINLLLAATQDFTMLSHSLLFMNQNARRSRPTNSAPFGSRALKSLIYFTNILNTSWPPINEGLKVAVYELTTLMIKNSVT